MSEQNQYQVAFDLDDVVFQTSAKVVEVMKKDKVIPSNFELEDLNSALIQNMFGNKYIGTEYFNKEVLNKEFYLNIPINEQVVKDIKVLKNTKVKFCFITSRGVPEYNETIQVLEQLDLYDNNIYLCKTDDKISLAKQLGVKIIVDDRPEVAFLAQKENMICFTPEMPYNKYLAKFNINVGKWSELRKEFFKNVNHLA